MGKNPIPGCKHEIWIDDCKGVCTCNIVFGQKVVFLKLFSVLFGGGRRIYKEFYIFKVFNYVSITEALY